MKNNEVNVHSRNLKTISVIYILFWVLNLEKLDGNVNLYYSNFKVWNPELYPYIAFTLLGYFIYRYYLSYRIKFRTIKNDKFRLHEDEVIRKEIKDIDKIVETDFKNSEESRFWNGFSSSIENGFVKSGINNIKGIYDVRFKLKGLSRHKGVIYCSYSAIAEINDKGVKSLSRFPAPRNYELDFEAVLTAESTRKYRRKVFLKSVFLSEETVDYILPWVLGIMAVITSILHLNDIELNI